MSTKILGNNSFENIPLLDTTAGTWAEGVNRCDPLFRSLAIVGLSALYHGVKESSESQALDTLKFEDLFDESGMYIGDALSRRMLDGQYQHSPEVDHYVAGMHIAWAALTATRLFNELPVINDDYTGQTGVNFVNRRVAMPIGDARAAGKMMNVYAVRDLQARVFTRQTPDQDSSYTKLDFAASLYSAGSLPSSITTSLGVSIDSENQSTEARVTSGERQGDFVHTDLHTDFGDLYRYARVVNKNL